jgi:hypothetical protein
MKTIRIFSLLLCGALFVLAACEGGFVEPGGKLIVENQSSSTITSVQIDIGPILLVRWEGSAGNTEKITLKSDPGTYKVYVEYYGEDSEKKLSAPLTVSIGENEEKYIIFNDTAGLQPAP